MKASCRNREGLAFGVCGGRLAPLTLWSGGQTFRKRLYCTKCGKVASDRRDA